MLFSLQSLAVLSVAFLASSVVAAPVSFWPPRTLALSHLRTILDGSFVSVGHRTIDETRSRLPTYLEAISCSPRTTRSEECRQWNTYVVKVHHNQVGELQVKLLLTIELTIFHCREIPLYHSYDIFICYGSNFLQ